MSEPAIVVEDLQKYFPPAVSGWRAFLHPIAKATQCALAGISFTVQRGEAAAIVGHNGAGKSTLLRILATLILPTRGQALLGGCDVEQDGAGARAKLGYHTGGDEGFYTRLTGRQNLEFFASMNNLAGGEVAGRITAIAERLGIVKDLDRQVRTLSTGMTHRLGLARALLHGPEVLLLDEPTRSLDPLGAAEFRRLLKEDLVGKRGTTLLFASHTLAEVEEIADRVIVLDHGELVANDPPAWLMAKAGETSLEGAILRITRPKVSAKALP